MLQLMPSEHCIVPPLSINSAAEACPQSVHALCCALGPHCLLHGHAQGQLLRSSAMRKCCATILMRWPCCRGAGGAAAGVGGGGGGALRAARSRAGAGGGGPGGCDRHGRRCARCAAQPLNPKLPKMCAGSCGLMWHAAQLVVLCSEHKQCASTKWPACAQPAMRAKAEWCKRGYNTLHVMSSPAKLRVAMTWTGGA